MWLLRLSFLARCDGREVEVFPVERQAGNTKNGYGAQGNTTNWIYFPDGVGGLDV